MGAEQLYYCTVVLLYFWDAISEYRNIGISEKKKTGTGYKYGWIWMGVGMEMRRRKYNIYNLCLFWGWDEPVGGMADADAVPQLVGRKNVWERLGEIRRD